MKKGTKVLRVQRCMRLRPETIAQIKELAAQEDTSFGRVIDRLVAGKLNPKPQVVTS